MNVLYVNHTGEISGGERSLLTLLGAPPGGLGARLATPPGALATAAERLGLPTTRITGTAGSLRAHPLHTSKALLELGLAAGQVRRAARRHHIELAHANSIRAGVILGLARPPGVATVVHVRDCLPPGPLTSATMRLIAATATSIVANSRYTADAMRAAAPGARVEVVYNPVDLDRFDPIRIDRAHARARLWEEPGDGAGGSPGEVDGAAPRARADGDGGAQVVLGVVAQISPWKGQDTAIEALRLLVADGVDAHLLLIGSAKFVARATRFDNVGYREQLRARVTRDGLRDRVHWLGEREDVPELMRALDVLLLPSHEEPFGRALIEAMALGVPVIATRVGGPAEILADGREGLLLAPRDAPAWARAIRRIVDGPELAARMGQAGRRRVLEAFTPEYHREAMLGVYERALTTLPTARRRG